MAHAGFLFSMESRMKQEKGCVGCGQVLSEASLKGLHYVSLETSLTFTKGQLKLVTGDNEGGKTVLAEGKEFHDDQFIMNMR